MLVFIREIGRYSRGHFDVLQSSHAMPDHVSTEQPLNILNTAVAQSLLWVAVCHSVQVSLGAQALISWNLNEFVCFFWYFFTGKQQLGNGKQYLNFKIMHNNCQAIMLIIMDQILCIVFYPGHERKTALMYASLMT